MLKNKIFYLKVIVVAFLFLFQVVSFAIPIAQITSPLANAVVKGTSVVVYGYAGVSPQQYTLFYKTGLFDPTWKPFFSHYVGSATPQFLGGLNVSSFPAYAFIPIKLTVYQGTFGRTPVIAEHSIVVVRTP